MTMHDDVIAALDRAIRRAMLLPFGHRDAPTIKADVTALRAHADELRRGGWRDIASAPKDGRYIIAGCFNRDELLWVKHSRWVEDGDSVDYVCGWTNGNTEDDACFPTHWQPLPAPPTKGNDDAE